MKKKKERRERKRERRKKRWKKGGEPNPNSETKKQIATKTIKKHDAFFFF
jgi:hypothetical protein